LLSLKSVLRDSDDQRRDADSRLAQRERELGEMQARLAAFTSLLQEYADAQRSSRLKGMAQDDEISVASMLAAIQQLQRTSSFAGTPNADGIATREFLAQRPLYSQDTNELQQYVELAVDWEAMHGLLFRAPGSETATWQQTALVPAPITLAPSPIPRSSFDLVVSLQPTLNTLFDRISRDHDFLVSTLQSLGTSDEFTTRVFQMYLKQRLEGAKKPCVIGIHRSDYLINAGAELQAKQVEFNTIAASFASLSAVVGDFHRYMLERTAYKHLLKAGLITREQIPPNESLTSIGDGIAAGFELYGQSEAVVVMVVQPGERNVYDQRFVEKRLWERHHIKTLRLTFAEIRDQCVVDENDRLLIAGQEIAVAYYRSGYAPTDFPTTAEWTGRWLVEKSRAIAVPSLAYHLAGCKKIQQVLANPGVVERFIDDAETAARVRECFVGLYPLDNTSQGMQATRMALHEPHKYVVKPQREGGGYNVYGDDIPKLLTSVSDEERKGYILMDLIRAPPFNSVLVRNGEVVVASVVSELGIYGIFVR
ncbi:Glutathione synthetase, partial [Coemansia sp. RSA 370]